MSKVKKRNSGLATAYTEVFDLLVLAEDKRFYSHCGIDIKAVVRAAIVNLKERRYAQGGSTITQQLARILYLNNRKNIRRKVIEGFLAFYLEAKYTKQEIISLYAQECPLGQGVKGFSSAAKHYFGKRLDKLSLAEKASLVAMLVSPERYAIGSKLLVVRTMCILEQYYTQRIRYD